MCQIINVYDQQIPAVRFIGVKFGDGDRKDGSFAHIWEEWLASDRFSPLVDLVTEEFCQGYEEAWAYLGFMRMKEGEPFEYWLGMFLPEGAAVPEGFEFFDVPAAKLGVCWVKGPDREVYFKEDKCVEVLDQNGFEVVEDASGVWCFFERYVCPRFTTPDDEGNVVLDLCHYIK